MNKASLMTALILTVMLPCMVLGQDIAPVHIVGSMFGRVSVTSWKETRNESVIRQKHDFSCGAAALATLLTHYYGIKVGEEEILKAVDKEGWLSLGDIQQVLPKYGMKGIGLALNYEQLTKLKIPVIVYIENSAGPHFAVLRGISEKTVWVADPAKGNNKYPMHKFREKWEVRPDAEFQGKILVVLPTGETTHPVNNEYFVNQMNK